MCTKQNKKPSPINRIVLCYICGYILCDITWILLYYMNEITCYIKKICTLY